MRSFALTILSYHITFESVPTCFEDRASIDSRKPDWPSHLPRLS